jgi:tetratricopeptide (TPR) repeat protein
MKNIFSILTILLLTLIFFTGSITTLLATDENDWWFNKGNDLFHQKKYEESLKHFNKAIKIDPNDFFAWHMKGSCLTMLKRYDQALTALDKAIKLNSGMAPSYLSKGAVLAAMKKYEEAISAIDHGLLVFKELEKELDFLKGYENQLAGSYFLKGQSLLALSKFKEAIDSFDSGLSIEPNNYLLWCMKGMALDSIGKKEAALEAFSKAQKYSNDVDVCSSLILLY